MPDAHSSHRDRAELRVGEHQDAPLDARDRTPWRRCWQYPIEWIVEALVEVGCPQRELFICQRIDVPADLQIVRLAARIHRLQQYAFKQLVLKATRVLPHVGYAAP